MSDAKPQLANPLGSTLLPCPFCGGPSTLLALSGMWSAGCYACGIETMLMLSESEARQAWNQRKEWDHARIGAEMREARQKAKISGRQIAARMELSPAYVSDLELGRRCWTPEKLRWYVDALSPNSGISEATSQHPVGSAPPKPEESQSAS